MGGKGGEKEKKGRRKEERKEVDVGKERCHVITKEKMRWYWYSQWNPALLELLMCWKTEKKEVAWYLLKFIAEFCFCTECLVLTPKIILKMQQNLPCSNEQRKAKTFIEQFIRLRWWSTLVKTRFLAEDGFHCAHLLGRHQLSLIRQVLNAALEVDYCFLFFCFSWLSFKVHFYCLFKVSAGFDSVQFLSYSTVPFQIEWCL